LPGANDALQSVINASSVFLGLTFILTGLACVVHFRRKGYPVTDLTRIVLPALGTLAVTVLLVVNWQHQGAINQRAAIICLIAGVLFAAVQRLPKPARPEYPVPAG